MSLSLCFTLLVGIVCRQVYLDVSIVVRQMYLGVSTCQTLNPIHAQSHLTLDMPYSAYFTQFIIHLITRLFLVEMILSIDISTN